MNHGFFVVIATDCVAGDPPEYAELVLANSLRNIAFLATSDEISSVWRRIASESRVGLLSDGGLNDRTGRLR